MLILRGYIVMKKLLLFVTILLTVPSADAMSFARNIFTRKVFDCITKVAFYAPSILLSAYATGDYIKRIKNMGDFLSELKDADEDTARFVRQNLAKIGVKNPEAVR